MKYYLLMLSDTGRDRIISDYAASTSQYVHDYYMYLLGNFEMQFPILYFKDNLSKIGEVKKEHFLTALTEPV